MHPAIISSLRGVPLLPPSERRAAGKALRSQVPRSSHALRSPALDRPDPIGILETSNQSRLADLVPIRYGRMLLSPFAFLRGSASIPGASDIFLGWAHSNSRDFYVRQLRDMSLSPHIEHLRVGEFIAYVEICGWVLARAHARSGDAVQLSSYLGKSDGFDQALATFATSYTDQVERDYSALVKAAQTGRIYAAEEI